MSHNIEQIQAQAEHLAKLKIAERCKRDLYFLAKYILGYEDMQPHTHRELCEYTSSLLPHTVNSNEGSTDRGAVAEYTLDDPNTTEHVHDSTPYSTPNEPLGDSTSHSDPPSRPSTKIFESKIFEESFSEEQIDPNIPQKISEELKNGMASQSQEMTVAHATDTNLQAKHTGNEDNGGFDPDKRMLHIEMPRGTFKSSVVTIGFALQFHLNDPNARILIDSETYSKGRNFLVEIRGHLEDNEKFREVYFTLFGCYPDDGKRDTSVRWKDSEMDLAARTKKRKEATFTASGIDKSINGMHYDLIICDDLHSEKNVTNKEQIQQVVDHWKLALSLLDPNKYMIVIGTRWHFADAYDYLLRNERNRFNVYIRKAHNSDGSLLFPERMDERFLQDQRRSMGTYLYSCQYENSPVDDETATFKRSYLKVKPWELIEGMPINWYMAVDPSWEGKESDYAALVVAGLDFQGNLYVRHVSRKKMTYGDIINEMFYLYNKYKPREIALETIATQKSIQYMLNQEQKARGSWLPVREINARTHSKEERIRGLAPYYEFGRAIHVQECPQREDLEDELLQFPKGENDDVIDALATILEIAKPAKPQRTSEDREKRERQLAKFTKPRSPYTKV